MKKIKLGNRWLGEGEPCYIIAEVGSNFDGSYERAEKLITLAKECGADAVKFQSFLADKIVSKEGFESMSVGFQANWDKSVYEVYKAAEFSREWHTGLCEFARKAGIDFFSSPYDMDAVDLLVELDVPALKIGSGDITWHEILKYMAGKGRPLLLGTGASTLAEVDEAIRVIREAGNEDIVLLQCVTNYPSTFESANIRAMVAMGKVFDLPVGYSDHTPGYIVPLGAVALGACVIEKHFTDDKTRNGPDHPHAMDAVEFKEMVEAIRTLETSLGSPVKDLYDEESVTVIIQRRCLRAAEDIPAGTRLTPAMIDVLRPSAEEGIEPKYRDILTGKVTKMALKKGDVFTWDIF